MPELILFSFIALLIGGMLWSDRDSRRVRWYERDGFAEALLSLSHAGMSAAKVAENMRQSIVILSTPTSSDTGFYDHLMAKQILNNEGESRWNTKQQDPVQDINDMATECGWPTIPTERPRNEN